MTAILSEKIVYDHRGKAGSEPFGHIGEILYELPADIAMTIGGKIVPTVTVHKLINYGLSQIMRDSYASATSPDDAKAKFAAKLAAAMDGTLSVRANAAGDDEPTLAAREFVRKALATNPAQSKAYKKLTEPKARAAFLDEIIARNTGKENFDAGVAREIAERAAARAKRVDDIKTASMAIEF